MTIYHGYLPAVTNNINVCLGKAHKHPKNCIYNVAFYVLEQLSDQYYCIMRWIDCYYVVLSALTYN